jgi:hypothetical protein
VVIALLQALFMEADKALPGSVLLERLARDVDALRSAGEDLPQAPQAYVAEWLNQGWLTRRFPTGAPEEEYELSAEALTALRFVTGLLKPGLPRPRAGCQSSSTSCHAWPRRRTPALKLVWRRYALSATASTGPSKRSNVEPSRHSPDRALERAREVIALAQELAADFRSVRDEFERLNRGLRQSLMENYGSRGDVLEQLFAGVDLIGESDAGRPSMPSGGC